MPNRWVPITAAVLLVLALVGAIVAANVEVPRTPEGVNTTQVLYGICVYVLIAALGALVGTLVVVLIEGGKAPSFVLLAVVAAVIALSLLIQSKPEVTLQVSSWFTFKVKLETVVTLGGLTLVYASAMCHRPSK